MALSATAEYYEQEDCATKIIPLISHLLIDKEKSHLSKTQSNSRIVRVQAAKTMDTFLSRIAKLTSSMPDTALPVAVDTPRSITPNQAPSSENFALTAGSTLAGWAISGLKSKVLGEGEIRPDSAPPSQSRFDTPSGLRGLGTQGDVDAWTDKEFDNTRTNNGRSRQRTAPTPQVAKLGMKLPVKGKKSVAEMVVEEEKRKSLEETGDWPGMEDWEDESKEDGWGFDD